MNKRTAIIIPHVNGNELELQKCMESVIEYSKDYDYEIFIVKNNYISFSWAVNQAIRQIINDRNFNHLSITGSLEPDKLTELVPIFDKKFDGIFIFNDDMIITNKDWLKSLYEVMEKEKVDLVVANSLHRNIGTEKEMCAMGFALFKPEVFLKIGFFDERFFIGEWDDVDLSVRMRDAGLKMSHISDDPWQHFKGGSRAFNKLEDKKEIYNNKQRFKEKWQGTKWGEIWW